MEKEPLATVLMPNYNNEAYLREAIESILKQSYTNFIFLIVDDGSTDNSINIIKSYDDKRIKLILKEKNSGIVDTLNLGIQNISSDYLVRMDGDDISLPTRLEKLIQFMEDNPHIGMAGSDVEIFGNDNKVVRFSDNSDKIKARLIFNGGMSHPSLIIRLSHFKKKQLYYSNEFRYMEDYDLYNRTKGDIIFGNLSLVLYRYRLLDHNSTVKNQSTLLSRYEQIYHDILNELEITATKKNLNLHTGLFLNEALTYKVVEYKKHAALILSQNKKLKIYPQKALEEIINEKWHYFFFKTAESSINKSLAYFWVTKKIKYMQFNYLLKTKLKSLFRLKR